MFFLSSVLIPNRTSLPAMMRYKTLRAPVFHVRTRSRTFDNANVISIESNATQDDPSNDQLNDPMDEHDLELDAIALYQAVDLESDIDPDHCDTVYDATLSPPIASEITLTPRRSPSRTSPCRSPYRRSLSHRGPTTFSKRFSPQWLKLSLSSSMWNMVCFAPVILRFRGSNRSWSPKLFVLVCFTLHIIQDGRLHLSDLNVCATPTDILLAIYSSLIRLHSPLYTRNRLHLIRRKK